MYPVRARLRTSTLTGVNTPAAEPDIAGIITLTALARSPPKGAGRQRRALPLAILAGIRTLIQLVLLHLIGTGGILGLHRTMRLEPMAAGIKSRRREHPFPKKLSPTLPHYQRPAHLLPRKRYLCDLRCSRRLGTPPVSLASGVIIQIPLGTSAILAF
jgi:hypothetical protein